MFYYFVICDIYKKSVFFSQLLLTEESMLHCIYYHDWLGWVIIRRIYYDSSHSQVVTEITTYGCLFFHRESIDLLFVHSTVSWLTIYLGRKYTGLPASTIPLHSSDRMQPNPKHFVHITMYFKQTGFYVLENVTSSCWIACKLSPIGWSSKQNVK